MKQKFEIHFWNNFSHGLKIVAYTYLELAVSKFGLMSSISIHNCPAFCARVKHTFLLPKNISLKTWPASWKCGGSGYIITKNEILRFCLELVLIWGREIRKIGPHVQWGSLWFHMRRFSLSFTHRHNEWLIKIGPLEYNAIQCHLM